MKLIFENWRKHINESVIDHIQYDVEDLADEGMNAKQIFNNLMSKRDDLQGKEQEVKAAIAKLLNIGPQSIEDETGQARLQETNEAAVPHSAEHVVKKMRKTGLSAKKALKSLTTNLSDEEAKNWLTRNKDEMDAAEEKLDRKKGMD